LKRTKSNLLNFADREPYEPVTELIDVPTALLEIVSLAEKAEKGDTSALKKIKEIMISVIDVVLADPESLLKLENMVQNGYRIAFLPTEKTEPINPA
jgi:hypothetical protein